MSTKTKIFIAVGLVGVAVAGRLVPHPWNFTPMVGAALAAGAYLGWRWGMLVPLVSLLLTDMLLGFYSASMLAVVYASMVLVGLAGYVIRREKTPRVVLGASFFSSTFFYLSTNGAVWLFGSMYPHTFDGLMLSYVMGLPFYRNALTGDLFFTACIFGAFYLASVALRTMSGASSDRLARAGD